MGRKGRMLLVSLMLLLLGNLVGLQSVCASIQPEHCEHEGSGERAAPHQMCPGDICHAPVSLTTPERFVRPAVLSAMSHLASADDLRSLPAGSPLAETQATADPLSHPAGSFPLLI